MWPPQAIFSLKDSEGFCDEVKVCPIRCKIQAWRSADNRKDPVIVGFYDIGDI